MDKEWFMLILIDKAIDYYILAPRTLEIRCMVQFRELDREII